MEIDKPYMIFIELEQYNYVIYDIKDRKK